MSIQTEIVKILNQYKVPVNIKMNAEFCDGKNEHFIALGKNIDNEQLVEDLVMLTMNSKTDQVVPCRA
jgi:hypothetical protein